jgi:hypothetical protein
VFYLVCLGSLVALLTIGRLTQRLFDVLPLVADDLAVTIDRKRRER